MNTTTQPQNEVKHQLEMYQAAAAAYKKEAAALCRVISPNIKILSANVFFTCLDKLTGQYFSHQAAYSHKEGGIPPELTDFIKLHIDALDEAVKTIEEKILSLQTSENGNHIN